MIFEKMLVFQTGNTVICLLMLFPIKPVCVLNQEMLILTLGLTPRIIYQVNVNKIGFTKPHD